MTRGRPVLRCRWADENYNTSIAPGRIRWHWCTTRERIMNGGLGLWIIAVTSSKHMLSRAENADEQTPHRTALPDRNTLRNSTPQTRDGAVYG